MPEMVDAHVVHWPDEDLDLGLHPGGLILVGAYHGEGPHPLAIQAHVLSEALLWAIST